MEFAAHSSRQASSSELVLGNGGSDGGVVSLLQDADVGALILQVNPNDFSDESSVFPLGFFSAAEASSPESCGSVNKRQFTADFTLLAYLIEPNHL